MSEWKELLHIVRDTDLLKESIRLLKMMLIAKESNIPGECGNFHSPFYMIVHLNKVDDLKRLLQFVQPHWIGSECNLLVRKVAVVTKFGVKTNMFRIEHSPMLKLQIYVGLEQITIMNRVLKYEDNEGKSVTEKYNLLSDGREVFEEHKSYTIYPSMNTSD